MSEKQGWPRIGALWQKEKEDGTTTFSGSVKVNGVDVPLFVRANKFYDQDVEAGKNAPQWHVFQAPPREGR